MRGAVRLVVALSLAAAGCGTTVPAQTLGAGAGNGVGTTDSGLGLPAAAEPGAPADGLAGPPAGSGGVDVPGAPSGGSPTAADAPGQAARPGPTPRTASASAIPTTGRGWDRQFVYVGVATQKDVQQAFASVGVSGLDAGDQEGQALAIVAELNRRGGLFGRQIKLVFRDHATIATAQDPETTAQATCTHFTQDRPVVMMLNPVTLMDGTVLRSCFAKARVPLLSASLASLDQRASESYAPYLYASVAPVWDALTPVLMARLKAQGYFGGWDAAAGRAVSGGAKVGILLKDDDVGPRVLAMLSTAVQRAGASGVETYAFKEGSEMQAAVLQFRGRGVTHVLSTDGGALLAFMLSADSQGFRPRYALSSFLTPAALLEGTAPPSQLEGAVGVGWSPSIDVTDERDPGPTGPAETECLQMLAKGGQRFDGKRLAEAVAFAFCDGLRLLVSAATAAGGLTGPHLAAGIARTGPSLSSAFSFGNGLGPRRYFLPGGVRDLRYDSGCRCFAYTGSGRYAL